MLKRMHLLATVAGAAVLAVTGCAGGNGNPTAAPVAVTGSAPTGVASAGPATTRSGPASPAPSTAAPKSAAKPGVTPRTQGATNGCPVSAATLEAASGGRLKGWHVAPSSIECSDGWAVAAWAAPRPELQGDGVIVYRYNPQTKKWKYEGEGSAIDCAEWGISKEAGRHLSICKPGR